MVLSDETITISDVNNRIFPDVPQTHPFAKYIKAAVEAGLSFGNADGSFKPDQALTLTECIGILNNANIIELEEVEETNEPVKRHELAEFLAYTPKFELKIERLINWERGY